MERADLLGFTEILLSFQDHQAGRRMVWAFRDAQKQQMRLSTDHFYFISRQSQRWQCEDCFSGFTH